jgi:outer membrane protein
VVAYDLKITKNSRLPNLNAAIGQSFDFGRSSSRDGTIVDQNSMSTSFNLTTNMPLFSGLRIYNEIKSGKSNLSAATEDVSKAMSDLKLAIVTAYLSVLFNKELLNVAQSQVLLTQDQVLRAEKLVENGKAATSELYEAKALLAQDELSVTQCNNTLQLSLLDLAQLMELQEVAGFDVEMPKMDEKQLFGSGNVLLNADTTFHSAVLFRPEIKAAQYRLDGSKHDLRIMQSYLYPNISLQAGYNNGYYHLNKLPEGVTQDPFWDQFNLNHREYVGINLSIPIFNRLETLSRIKIARLQIDQQALQVENAKKTLLKEIQQAYYNAVAAQKKYDAAKNSVVASQEAFRYAEERYDAGRGTNFEFNDAKTRFIKSQSDLLQAKYEYLFRCRILKFYYNENIDI